MYGTFKSHKSRKHKIHNLEDFKDGVVQRTSNESVELESADGSDTDNALDSEPACSSDTTCTDAGIPDNQAHFIEHKLAAVLLKLENIFHVPSAAVSELLEELHYLLSTASLCNARSVIDEIMIRHHLQIDQSVTEELASAVCVNNPVCDAIGKGSPLRTSFKRKSYYRQNFKVVEPVEYFLDDKRKRTMQYVPVLKLLQLLLSNKNILDTLDTPTLSEVGQETYASYRDGMHFKNNDFLSCDELRILLNLYVDDFEICNPLGTSRKKHKICAVYWNLGNLPPGESSSLSSIYLALLCRSDDVKNYGYEKILEPLLEDLSTLESQGIFIAQLGSFIKGTV